MRKVYLKINRKVHARFLRKARARPAQGLRKVRARPAQDPRKARARPAQGPRKTRARPAQGPRKAPPQARPQKNKCVSNDRSRHDDSNGPRIVKIGAILAIFEHFKVWTSAQDLRARSRKTFRARPRLVNLFYKLL